MQCGFYGFELAGFSGLGLRAVVGEPCTDQATLDKLMVEQLDGSKNEWGWLGALAVAPLGRPAGLGAGWGGKAKLLIILIGKAWQGVLAISEALDPAPSCCCC